MIDATERNDCPVDPSICECDHCDVCGTCGSDNCNGCYQRDHGQVIQPATELLPVVRSCTHTESIIVTVGDLSQQAYLSSTVCSLCREMSPRRFGRGRGGSR